MSLQSWEKNSWLVKHKPYAREIGQILGLADRDLKDSQVEGITADWKLTIAYNSALQSATAALLACGYRASREMHHFRVIGSLAYTIGASADLINRLDKFRKKRNISDYEMAGAVSEGEAKEMLQLAKVLRREVEEWLKKSHPGLMSKR
ncbi:MAG: hypothetical protein A3D28_00230 [Omnitrophica bacterium RIFCSPHIGHO2_02_FULL_63_14]|nr:MAG: hypothetical protein A3D28_00230 [Omnitrophica bacterium RIFCSPHIGHO2_02_FULL_63_14]